MHDYNLRAVGHESLLKSCRATKSVTDRSEVSFDFEFNKWAVARLRAFIIKLIQEINIDFAALRRLNKPVTVGVERKNLRIKRCVDNYRIGWGLKAFVRVVFVFLRYLNFRTTSWVLYFCTKYAGQSHWTQTLKAVVWIRVPVIFAFEFFGAFVATFVGNIYRLNVKKGRSAALAYCSLMIFVNSGYGGVVGICCEAKSIIVLQIFGLISSISNWSRIKFWSWHTNSTCKNIPLQSQHHMVNCKIMSLKNFKLNSLTKSLCKGFVQRFEFEIIPVEFRLVVANGVEVVPSWDWDIVVMHKEVSLSENVAFKS